MPSMGAKIRARLDLLRRRAVYLDERAEREEQEGKTTPGHNYRKAEAAALWWVLGENASLQRELDRAQERLEDSCLSPDPNCDCAGCSCARERAGHYQEASSG